MTFTDRVRDELARVPVPEPVLLALEVAGLLRTGGVLTRAGGAGEAGLGVRFRTGSGPVVRRLLAALRVLGAGPRVEAHRPVGLRPTTYALHVGHADRAVLAGCGLLDGRGRPQPPPEPPPDGPRDAVAAYLRGAVMGGGILSDPRAPAHAEVSVAAEATALHLEALLQAAGVRGARAARHGDGWRVVGKSGEEIGALLALLGAHQAFLDWDGARLRRELRSVANRVANADRANLARSVGAAGRQVAAIGRLVAARGWEGLPDDLSPVALARVANPQASLAELGALLDPPVGKAAVHRRLAALVALAGRLEDDPPGPPGEPPEPPETR